MPLPRRGALRVYCLAEQLGISLPELLEELHDLGIRGCTPSSLVDEWIAAEVCERLGRQPVR
ncbi:translation initiation factor IF-2 N-terminal domain-containing protein [Longimycelium tulufanense]|uniref:translation initiation factor IF-2 N-terminal domain-containing protein n=1 Tax=Longimycelium tulufanense TaxID=907463 RepID=UPI0016683FF8|nr:translation initiation factor IF-2 N-terminal domain-containing protein [Longimycelium tulufanense]